MARRLVAFTAAAAALTISLAGCGGSDKATGGSSSGAAATTTTASSAASGGDATAWAEKVCASVAPQVTALSTQPEIDQSNPVKAQASLVEYLDKFSGALDKMISSFGDAGDPPVADGKALVAKATSALEEAKTAVDTAKTNLAAASPSDPAAFQAAFLKVGEDLQALQKLEDPTKGLRGSAELDKAFKAAPSCKALDGDSASGTASSTPTS
ncbi:hypothetical protein [Actinokineospora cianjurensis]|uniref:Small secreted protein n=1 Tax=Actinokineospora cianjurensis TaxID=585224 RepID=A0A421B5W6_9PSEU|nr:hypothetical protein [Actinokineospora cianjurensis]RLK59876.1 hypothetical protein CLV68_0364 [Actinokineospora cianjurensis]